MREGTLKIFLGISPGVGKTYKMLLEGHKLAKDGCDLIIGYIEPHKRKETQQLVSGLEQLEKQKILYKNKEFEEIDLYALVNRKPQIVLIDELAHTNAPGLKNEKRWQDIAFLLEKGISVFTTLNIQHIESLQIPLSQSSKIFQHEQVPDFFIDDSVEIELIDPPPILIRERMLEGKIYAHDKIKSALSQYFTLENLEILREYTYIWLANRGFNMLRRNYQNLQVLGFGEYIFVLICDHYVEKELIYRANLAKARLINAQFAVIRFLHNNDDDYDIDNKPGPNFKLQQFISFVESFGGEYYEYKEQETEDFKDFMIQKNCTRVFVSFHNNFMKCRNFRLVKNLLKTNKEFELTFIPSTINASPIVESQNQWKLFFRKSLNKNHYNKAIFLLLSLIYLILFFYLEIRSNRRIEVFHLDLNRFLQYQELLIFFSYPVLLLLCFWKIVYKRIYMLCILFAVFIFDFLRHTFLTSIFVSACFFYYIVQRSEKQINSKEMLPLNTCSIDLNRIFKNYGQDLNFYILTIRIEDSYYLYENRFFYKKIIYLKNRRYYNLDEAKKINDKNELKILELNNRFHLLYSLDKPRSEKSLDLLKSHLSNYIFHNYYLSTKKQYINSIISVLGYLEGDIEGLKQERKILLKKCIYDLLKINANSDIRFYEKISFFKFLKSILETLTSLSYSLKELNYFLNTINPDQDTTILTIDSRILHYSLLLLFTSIDNEASQKINFKRTEQGYKFIIDKLTFPLDLNFLSNKHELSLQNYLVVKQEFSIFNNKILNLSLKALFSLENQYLKIKIINSYKAILEFIVW